MAVACRARWRRAPGRPAVSTGGMWSTPGSRRWRSTARRRARRRTDRLLGQLNSRMASGNQAIDGMVWSPVISEPIAARRTGERATSQRRSTTPMTSARAKPVRARRMVSPIASRTSCRRASPRRAARRPWPATGRTYSGRQPLHTTTCQTPRTMAIASSFGHVAAQIAAAASGGRSAGGRRARRARPARASRRRSGPAERPRGVLNDRPWRAPPRAGGSVTSAASARDVGRLDPARPRRCRPRTPRRPGPGGW